MASKRLKANPPKARRQREESHPFLRGLVLFACVAACAGALLWKGMGW